MNNLKPARTLVFFAPLALLAAAGVGGCASVNPAKDIERASAIVAAHSGFDPDWPATGDAVAWDGNSDLNADTAVRLALAHNRELRAGLERIAESRADLAQSGLLPNPVLNIALGFPLPGSGGDTTIGAGLTQQLVALLQRGDRMRAAEADLDREVLNASDLALRTVANARAAHAKVVFAQRLLPPHRSAADAADRAVETARRRFAAGEDTSLHINRQQLLLLRLRADLRAAETELAARKRELLAVIGRADAPAEWLAAEDLPGAPDDRLDESKVIALAVSQRLDVAAAHAACRAALARAGVEAKGRFGDIDAGVDYEHNDDGNNTLGPSLAIPIPIFDTGDAKVAKARAAARRAVIEADQVRDQAVLEARLAYIRAGAASSLAMDYNRDIVALAHQNLDLAQKSFASGQSDLTVLLEAEQTVVDANARLVTLQEQAALGRIELERAVGGRLVP